MSFSLAGVVTVKCMDWTSSSREIALSTVVGSWLLMFEKIFVFDVATVLFTIGVVSSSETRSCPSWFEHRLGSGSDWVLSFYS